MQSLHAISHAHQNKFAYEEKFMFLAQARRNKLIGLWAAAIMGNGDAEAYAEELKTADIVDPNGVFARLRSDFDAAGITVLDHDLHDRMSSMLKEVVQDMYRNC